jgi:hypothetical protein
VGINWSHEVPTNIGVFSSREAAKNHAAELQATKLKLGQAFNATSERAMELTCSEGLDLSAFPTSSAHCEFWERVRTIKKRMFLEATGIDLVDYEAMNFYDEFEYQEFTIR